MVIAFEAQDTLETSDMTAAAGDQQKQRAALGIALPDDRRETSARGDSAQDATDFDVGRKPAQWCSGRVALIGAEQHHRQRIAAARAAHLLEDRRIASHPADRCKGFQMVGAGIGR
jgi:hypothetical protein